MRLVVALYPMPEFSANARSLPVTPPYVGNSWRSAYLNRHDSRYILQAKRRGRVLAAVKHFHVRNGAPVARVNMGADWSAGRPGESLEVTVIYKCVL